MRGKKLYEKKRAPKGTGRAKTIPVQVSAELHGELSMIKDAYSRRLGRTVTFEQMLRRWVDRLSRIDPDVNKEYQVIRKTRLETEAGAASTAEVTVGGISERMQANGTSLMEEALKEQEEAKAALEEDLRAAAGGGDSPAPAEDQVQSPEPVDTPEVPVDPTEGEVWNMRYFFKRNEEEIEAYRGYWPGFFAEVDGEEREQKEMMADGWVLMNEAGIEISPDQAIQISTVIGSRKDFENTAYGHNLSLEEEGENIQEGPSAAAGDSTAPAEDQGRSPEPVATPLSQEGKMTEKRFVHPDGRSFRAVMGTYSWVPLNPTDGSWLSGKKLLSEGFELKDVEI